MVLKGVMTIELTDKNTGRWKLSRKKYGHRSSKQYPWPEPDGDLLCRHRGIRCGSVMERHPSAHLPPT